MSRHSVTILMRFLIIENAGWKLKSIKEREARLIEWATEEWAD